MKESEGPTSGDPALASSMKMEPPSGASENDPGEHLDDKKNIVPVSIQNVQNGKTELKNNGTPLADDVKPKLEDLVPSLPGENPGPGTPGSLPAPDNALPPPGSVPGPPTPGMGGFAPGPPSHGGPPLPSASGPGPAPPEGAPFMQQQSQLFVFSTSLANKAAEGVQAGQYKSIIDFHMDQPSTKQYLQTHPLKSSGPFPPRGGFMGGMRGPNPGPPNMKGGGPMMDMKMMGEGRAMNSVEEWVHQQNRNLQHSGGSFSPNPGPGGMAGNFSPQGGNPGSRFPGPGMGPGWPGGPGGPEDMLGMPPSSQFGPDHPFGRGSDLLQTKVPNENLTPEQLQRREEQLASLRKIQAMLFPDQSGGGGGPGGNMGGPGGGPGGPGMMGPGMNPNMGPGPGGMMHSPPMGPMGSPGGMMGGPMGPGGPFPGGPPGGMPPDWENLTPAQREWFKLQQEFVNEKRMKARQAMQAGMGGPMGNMGGGPPPPYGFSGPRGRGPMSPTSPSYNGGPMGGPSPGPGEQFMLGPRGMMGGPRGMGPGGFDPMAGPGNPGNMFQDIMGPEAGGPRAKMPMIHRAGNPERMDAGPNKPPPSYQASQKRKRSGDDLDDLYKKLQPAPSPQQFSYLNQFEGQELTITKQLNMAYQEGGSPGQQQGGPKSVPTPASQASDHFPQSNQSTGASTTGTSVASPLPPTSSAPVTTTASGTTPASPATATSRPPSQAGNPPGGRLSHYPPPGAQPGGNKKDALSNITSASLANLAKGVEHLSNQMQQNMMQGGPFHNIQVQGQMTDVGEGGSPSTPHSQGPPSSGPNPGPPNPGGPSVNNTYVQATMSIGQVNIQNVNSGGSHGNRGGPPCSASMQIQQMNTEQQQGMGGGGGMQQQSTQSFMGMERPGGPMERPGMEKGMFPSPGGMGSPGFPRTSCPTSSNHNPVGNANVQIQAKAPNTIQYLPANPPSSSAGPPGPGPGPAGMPGAMGHGMGGPPGGMPGKGMDMMSPRFPSPGMERMGPGPKGMSFPEMMGGPMSGGPRMGMGGNNPGMSMGSMMMQSQSMQGQMGGPGGGPMYRPPSPMGMGGPIGGPGAGSMGGPGGMGPGGSMGPRPQGGMMPADMMDGMGMQRGGMGMGGPPNGPPGGPMMAGPRQDGPGMMGGPGTSFSQGFQQFQQQLYSQGRSRQMSPMGMGGQGMPPQGSGMGPGGPMLGPGGPGMEPGGMGGPDMMGPGGPGMGPGPSMGMNGPGPNMGSSSGMGPGPMGMNGPSMGPGGPGMGPGGMGPGGQGMGGMGGGGGPMGNFMGGPGNMGMGPMGMM